MTRSTELGDRKLQLRVYDFPKSRFHLSSLPHLAALSESYTGAKLSLLPVVAGLFSSKIPTLVNFLIFIFCYISTIFTKRL